MATLLKTVNKTSVTFDDTFTYTINVAFSGIVGNINSAKITDFIPSYISYTLPASIPHIQSVTEEATTIGELSGTLITFDFGTITDLGVSISIKIDCKYKLGTDSQTEFINNSDLYINDVLDQSSMSDPVILQVSENFIIEKDIAVPGNRVSSAGGRVIFTIILRNRLKSEGGSGDPGAKITNVIINDLVPNGLTLDPNFNVIGSDISNNNYADNRYNGRLGVVTDNNITFTLPEYYGTRYRIVFICTVNEDQVIGTQIPNTADFYLGEISRGYSTATLTLGESNYTGSIIKYGPNYGSVGNKISFELTTGNYGNQDLLNFTIEDKIPDEVTAYRINTGSFKIDVINTPVPEAYIIEYKINNTGDYILLGNYNTQNAEYVTLPSVVEGQKITNIRWTIPNFPVGMIANKKIIIDGIITAQGNNSQITNIGEITYPDDTGVNTIQATHITQTNDKSELNLKKSVMNNVVNIIPGEIIRYAMVFNGNGSQINNPVVSDLLSDKLTYMGNEKYIYYDYFTNQTIDSNNSQFNSLVPIQKQVVNNYNNTGRTFISYNMDGFSLQQRGIFTIELDAKVNTGAVGNIVNNAVIGNKGDNGIVGPNQIAFQDIDDRDLDGISNETIVLSNNTTNAINYSAGLASNKKVKGALDEVYTEEPDVGLTYEGGSVDYKLVIDNIGNLDFNYLQIVDILPHIEDTGVILTNEQRGSDFNVYNINEIFANIIENNVVVDNVNLLVEYSKSYDPVRFSQNNFGDDNIGTIDDWSIAPPVPITETKSIRITMSDKLLLPNQSLVIDIHALAPLGVNPNLVAWNSFAIKARYIDENGLTQKLIPVEPEKVGVRVEPNTKASISGKTWLDSNENGNIDTGEVGLNGMGVMLLNENKVVLKQTITTNNTNNEPGYFIFNNLDVGNYYIQFVKSQGLYFTLYTIETQNKADTNTGMTSKIEITNTNQEVIDIDGGYIEGLDFIILLLEILNHDIYSANCDSVESMVESINYAVSTINNVSNMLIEYFANDINHGIIDDVAYKAQIQRFIYTLSNIVSKLIALNIPSNYCNIQLLSNILYVLAEYDIDLICILEANKGLNVYYNKCSCIGSSFYELIIGRFINEITKLDSITIMLNNLLGVLYVDTNGLAKSYVPMYVPQSNISIPPFKPMRFSCPPGGYCNK